MFDAPEGYEERCRPVRIAGLRHLRVYVPERLDLALMKAARGDERDLSALAAMHRRQPLRLKTRVNRYDEMQFTGSPEALRSKFLLLVARLFCESAAERLEPGLKARPSYGTRRKRNAPDECAPAIIMGKWESYSGLPQHM